MSNTLDNFFSLVYNEISTLIVRVLIRVKQRIMADRKDNLLRAIVEEHIDSAGPVGSGLIAEKYFPDLSSATIRNEMVQLEADGLIYQPYTSAGRVPTAAGYQYYLDQFCSLSDISLTGHKVLDAVSLSADRQGIKTLAKALADICVEAVLVGFSANDVYYTGIANLFRQPEFAKLSLVHSLSEVIDHLDEVMAQIFGQVKDEPLVLIGDNNPFGNDSSAIIVRYQSAKERGIIGILGPNRMDYKTNIALLKYSQKLLSNL